ncbi:unnamed protein product [Ceutorhynchus assimilis]|uniref:Uncharacterized protein n=1 Tax=Ceutorhynchus assimilis TaxID=467358 RepID=A0A9N9MGQ2_9CUCU|nr:unnamed protein product [Ceutorhynchus assimilis]
MESLESEDPKIWERFMDGNWVVNRSSVPFCDLCADETLEQQNRKLKIHGGLVGITLNENARNRLFLANSELSRIACETEKMIGFESTERKQRVYANNIPFWDPLKKNLIKTCKTAVKKVKITLKEKTVAIKTDLSLISRLMIASRSRPEIDLRYNLSNYEFSALPKSLFAVDGSMHHCLAKHKLTDALESMQVLPAEGNDNAHTSTDAILENSKDLQ